MNLLGNIGRTLNTIWRIKNILNKVSVRIVR